MCFWAETMSPSDFNDAILLNQLTQASCIKAQSEHYRRARSEVKSNGEGLTMGALYWQLNDIWQAPTWASLEYGGRWKVLHYFSANFFAPVLISPWTYGNQLGVHVVSDRTDALSAILRLRVLHVVLGLNLKQHCRSERPGQPRQPALI